MLKFAYLEPVLILSAVLLLARDEAAEVERLAPKYDAEIEVRLWDRTRVDLLNETHAIEVDYASKWAEGIGQALYYAAVTGKKPGLILLATDRDDRYIYRAQTVCVQYGITLMVERVQDAGASADR